MSDPFVGEVRAFGFSFAPRGWALCDGQLLPISSHTALFSLLGTTYGGDGRTTFALPDLRGRAAMHPGQGPGLSAHPLGESAGVEQVALTADEMPGHSHPLLAQAGPGDNSTPEGGVHARTIGATPYAPPGGTTTLMAAGLLEPAGSGQPHNNMMPHLPVNYCIALEGVFPPRG